MKKKKLTSDLMVSLHGNNVFAIRGYFNDANDTTLDTGIYGINTDGVKPLNIPSGVNYGGMIVFNGSPLASEGNPKFQMIFTNTGKLYIRSKWFTSEWKTWREL